MRGMRPIAERCLRYIFIIIGCNALHRNSYWPTWKPYVHQETEENRSTTWTQEDAKTFGELTPARFLTVDRFAEKYPSFTPYHYAANNPVIFVDVNGDSIWINDNGQRFLYTTGMKYTGKDKNVAGLIGHLNRLSTVKAGNIVLTSLIGSTANYNVSFNADLSTPGAFSSMGSNPGGNLLLNPGTFDFGTVAHEVFHGYQQEKGVWEESQMGEVEADLFSGAMRMATGEKNVTFGNPNGWYAAANYDRAMQSLVKSFNELTFWNDAVYQFETGSAFNRRGGYSTFPQIPKNPKILINALYPLLARRK